MSAKPAADTPPLIAALMEARCYPHPVGTVERIDTHISWVLLAGAFAYKIKKPVALGFLDFSTLEARRHFCAEELRLNRATAPQLYLEVVPVTGTAAAPALGGTGPAIEYALKMHRFAQDAVFDSMACRGELGPDRIDRLAAALAAFHARAAVAAPGDAHGSAPNVTQPAAENFAQISKLAPPADALALCERLRAWTAQAALQLAPAFAARKSAGRVRECHGDLHLGNIALIDGEPVPFDRIEFNPEWRWIDVMSEVAFLLMDLLDRGLAAQAWRCLDRYLAISGDYEGITVLRYYLVYRAMVRAKVALIRARQGVATDLRRDEEHVFLHHLELAAGFIAAERPGLVLMHGLSGSGKSTVSQALLELLGAVRVRSDVERKRLRVSAAAGLYSTGATRRTYARLAAVAETALSAGWCVIVDATFLQRAQRDEFRRLARHLGLTLLIVSCMAGEGELRERLVRRNATRSDASEADATVLARQIERQEPPGADEEGDLLVVDGGLDVAQVAARAEARLR
jgi:aminoglycoside phosphotransferase family enzyme/predicted kinase